MTLKEIYLSLRKKLEIYCEEKTEYFNDNSKCIKFNYKNDKYWFSWSWSVYKLDEFKSFYTKDYFWKEKN